MHHQALPGTPGIRLATVGDPFTGPEQVAAVTVRPWQRLASAPLADHGLFRVRRDRARSPRTGADLDFLVIETRDWLQVVPVTADGRLVLVRQYRHGSRRLGLEFPGGLHEADDGPPEAGAMRECLEETGYGGGSVTRIGDLSPHPALFGNRVHVFLAESVSLQAEIAPDPGEDLEVVVLTPMQFEAVVAAGEVENALTLAVWALARKRIDPD